MKQIPSNSVLSFDHYKELVTGNLYDKRLDGYAYRIMEDILKSRMEQKILTVINAPNLKMSDCKRWANIAIKYGNPFKIISIDSDLESSAHAASLEYLILENAEKVSLDNLKKELEKYENSNISLEQVYGEKFVRLSRNKSIGIDVLNIILDDWERYYEYEAPSNTNVWIIGDPHSCNEELDELGELIVKHSNDNGYTNFPKIFIAGDTIDRGPSMRKTWNVCKKYFMEVIPGNHESCFISERLFEKDCRSVARYISHTEFNMRWKASEREEWLNYMQSRPQMKIVSHEDFPGDTVVITHAGVRWKSLTNLPWETPPASACMTRSSHAVLDNYCEDYPEALFSHSEWTQVHGHLSHEYRPINEVKLNRVVNVDGGCVFGGELVAFNPFTKESIVVESKKDYSKEAK